MMSHRDSEADVAIINGKVVLIQGVMNGNVYIKNGKIAAISEGDFKAEAIEVIDAKGAYVIPGVVDPEVHIVSRVGINRGIKSDPPQITGAWQINEEKIGDYLTETEAAAHGGITCFSHWILLHDEPYLP